MYKQLTLLTPKEGTATSNYYDSYIKGTLVIGATNYGGYLCLASVSYKFNQLKQEDAGDVVFKVLKEGYYNEEDVKEYLRFLTNAGINMPDYEIDGENFIFTFPIKRYENYSEFLGSFTAVRYPFYNYARCREYVRSCINIHNTYDIPEMEAFQLAHYEFDYSDQEHELFYQPSKLLCKKEYMKANYNKGINKVFFKEAVSMTRKELSDIYKEDINKLYNILK